MLGDLPIDLLQKIVTSVSVDERPQLRLVRFEFRVANAGACLMMPA